MTIHIEKQFNNSQKFMTKLEYQQEWRIRNKEKLKMYSQRYKNKDWFIIVGILKEIKQKLHYGRNSGNYAILNKSKNPKQIPD